MLALNPALSAPFLDWQLSAFWGVRLGHLQVVRGGVWNRKAGEQAHSHLRNLLLILALIDHVLIWCTEGAGILQGPACHLPSRP